MPTMQPIASSSKSVIRNANPLPPHVLAASFPSDTRLVRETPDLLIAPAVTYQQRRACGALVRRMYAWRGYHVSPPAQPVDDPNHVILGAWSEGELIATLTGSRDSSNGLLADALYGEEIGSLRKPARTLCEVTRLAVDADNHDPELLKSLFSAATQYARAVFGGTDVVIEVNPRHAGYYRRELGFRQVGTLRTCPRVAAPAVLLHRTLGGLRF